MYTFQGVSKAWRCGLVCLRRAIACQTRIQFIQAGAKARNARLNDFDGAHPHGAGFADVPLRLVNIATTYQCGDDMARFAGGFKKFNAAGVAGKRLLNFMAIQMDHAANKKDAGEREHIAHALGFGLTVLNGFERLVKLAVQATGFRPGVVNQRSFGLLVNRLAERKCLLIKFLGVLVIAFAHGDIEEEAVGTNQPQFALGRYDAGIGALLIINCQICQTLCFGKITVPKGEVGAKNEQFGDPGVVVNFFANLL